MLIKNQMNSQMSNQLNSLITVLTYIVDLSVEVRARASAVSGHVCTYRECVLLSKGILHTSEELIKVL